MPTAADPIAKPPVVTLAQVSIAHLPFNACNNVVASIHTGKTTLYLFTKFGTLFLLSLPSNEPDLMRLKDCEPLALHLGRATLSLLQFLMMPHVHPYVTFDQLVWLRRRARRFPVLRARLSSAGSGTAQPRICVRNSS